MEHGFTFCTEFESELTRPQLHVCRREKNYLGCFALGMRRAVQWCVRVFNQSKWNCSHAVRELVFGRMVHTMSKCVCLSVCMPVCVSVCMHTFMHVQVFFRGGQGGKLFCPPPRDGSCPPACEQMGTWLAPPPPPKV